jgi:hypothetical protein
MTDQNDAEKPTEDWVTGDDPMTGPQRSYLETLMRGTGEEVPPGLTKAEASELIDRLSGGSDAEAGAPVGSAERIREAGIVDQQGVVADKIGASDDD